MNDGLKMVEFFTVQKKVIGCFEKKKSYRVYVGSIDNQGRAVETFNTRVAIETHEYNFEIFQRFFPEMCSWPSENIKGSPVLQHTSGYRHYEVNSTLLYFVFETSQRAKKFINEWGWLKEFVDLINFSRLVRYHRHHESNNPLTVWRDPKSYTGKQADIEKYFPVEWTELPGRAMNKAQIAAMRQMSSLNITNALENLTFPHWYGELYHPEEGRWKSLRFRTESEKLIFKMGYIPNANK